MYFFVENQLMRDSITTNNVWYDETSDPRWCQSRIRSSLHPLGEVINGDSTGDARGSSLNLRWGKCGVWWVDQWVHWELLISLDACLVITLIRDIDMLIMLIFYLVCLSIKALILPWLFCSLHMYRLIVIYLSTWCVDSFACILSWSSLSMLSLSLFTLIVIFSLSLRVDMCGISALCLTACCMIALLLHDCPFLAWLHVGCLCGPQIYPLTSNPLVFDHFFHLGSHFCKCEALCVLVSLTGLEARSRF